MAKKKIRNETSTKVHEIKVKGASNGNKKVKVRNFVKILILRSENIS